MFLFFTLLFPFIKKLFSSSSLSAIKVVSSTYLKLLIFLLAVLIPACDLCSPAFCIQVGFNNMWTKNLQMYKLDLEKAEEQEIRLPTFVGSSKKQGNSRKISTSALLITLKPLTVWTTTNCENSERDGNIRPPDPLPEKSVCRSGSNS